MRQWMRDATRHRAEASRRAARAATAAAAAAASPVHDPAAADIRRRAVLGAGRSLRNRSRLALVRASARLRFDDEALQHASELTVAIVHLALREPHADGIDRRARVECEPLADG